MADFENDAIWIEIRRCDLPPCHDLDSHLLLFATPFLPAADTRQALGRGRSYPIEACPCPVPSGDGTSLSSCRDDLKVLDSQNHSGVNRATVADTSNQAPSTPRSKESVFIYVVDDEPTLLELAEYILEMEGYQFEKFEEPKKALAAFQAADPKPDLLITDYVMLGMDGLQLVGECKRIKPDLKSILVSGTVQEEVVHRSNVRVDEFLRKPYLAQEFLETIRSVLNIQ